MVPLVIAALYYLTPRSGDAAGVVLDGDFGLRVAALAGVALFVLVAFSTLLFALITPTLEAVGMDGERVSTSYDFGGYMKRVLGWSALTVITLGLFAPWMVVRLVRYFLAGASYRHRPLGFHAHSMGLFSMIVLVLFLPIVLSAFLVESGVVAVPNILALENHTLILALVVVMLVVLLWMSFFCAVFVRWMVNQSCGEERIVSRLHVGKTTMYVMAQLLLTILTLGLYTPMMELRLLKYFAETVEVGEEHPRRMGMSLRSWRDWGYVWGQLLLVIVTLGLYMPWYYTKILRRFIPRLYLTSDK